MVECVIRNFKIHVEVPILLLFFAFLVSEPVRVNLIIYRTCYVTLGYNQSECALLGSKNPDNATAALEKLVEPQAALINMVQNIVESSFTAVICLFVGPWSDRFGRKPILLIPVIGFFLKYAFLAIFALIPEISPWYIMTSSIPIILTGGGSSFFTVVLCYVADVTSEQNRGLRMGFLEAVLSAGILLGNVSSSYILYATNYPTLFLISSCCCFIALMFNAIFIPESLAIRERGGGLRGLFQLTNITEMVKTTLKKRRHFERSTVLLCVLMMSLFILAIDGDSSVIFLYLREKFHWSLEKYTLFSAAHNVSGILGTIIGIYVIHKLLRVPETIMLLLGFISMLNGHLVIGLAQRDWLIYAGAISRSLGGVLSPMVRSLVSKIVPNEEIGKVFSLIVTSESMIGIAGSPIYTIIYNATLNTNPSIFCFVTVGIYLFEVIIAIIVAILRTKSRRPYDALVNEENQERNQDEV